MEFSGRVVFKTGRICYNIRTKEGGCVNILYLISYAGKSGTEKYVQTLMERLAAEGHTCHLVYQTAGALSEKTEEAGFPVCAMNLRPLHIFAAARSLAAYCRKHEIDVIHAQYPRENVIAVLAARRRRTKVVFTSHLTIEQGFLWRMLNRLVTPHDDCVISVCREGVELLRRNGVSPERIRMIGNGVTITPKKEKDRSVLSSLGVGEDCFVFTALLRYAPEKGIDTLLNGCAELKRRKKGAFVCLMAGDGELYDEATDRIRELELTDTVLQLGYRTDAETLLNASDAYVSSAIYNEAMSFAVLEAMAASLPLIVTDVGAGRSLAEGCGIAVKSGSASLLADAMETLLCDRERCRVLGEAARRKLEREYDLTGQIQKILEVYREKE